ncbi:MAG: hypothetical protein RR671_04480, partial [Raoultibacter sp.]
NAAGADKSIYLINNRCPEAWEESNNITLMQATERHSNVKLIDWFGLSANHDEYFDGDGTHLTEDAAQIYTAMIQNATAADMKVVLEEKAKAEEARQEALAAIAAAEAKAREEESEVS